MDKATIALIVSVVALVITGYAVFGTGHTTLFGSTDCQTTTCLTGGLAITTGNFSVDAGTANISATTTLADTVQFTNPALCVNFYATSTATVLHLVASTTATLPAGAAAVMTANYGACAN